MNNQQEDPVKKLRRETASLIEERGQQSEILSANLNRLHHLFADMTELHVSVLEQMSQTQELLTVINELRGRL